MRRTATSLLALVLMAGEHAAAQMPTVINLSCDRTVKTGASDDEQPVRKMGLIVNLAQRTVSGFAPVAHITDLDDVNVSFSGETVILGGVSSVIGGIDRVTGRAGIHTVLTAKDGKIIMTENYELVCKVTNRLF